MSGGLSILFVDDDATIRDVAALRLGKLGFDCDTAENGLEAVGRLKQRPYDVAVIDIVMPEKEGLETIIEVRRDWPGVRIVAISGGGRVGPDEFLSLARSFGASRTLKKPFRTSDLVEAIAAAAGRELDGSPGERAA